MTNMNAQDIATIMNMLDTMSVEEMKNRLATYMMADEKLTAHPAGVEVRLNETADRGGRYQVLILMEDGTEREVKFRDRYSRLVYIYTLLHPEGYQRRSLEKGSYKALRELFSKIYFTSADPLLRSIERLGFEQFFCQAVSQSRVAVRNVIGKTDSFEIAMPQRHAGKTIIGCASNREFVVIDNSLLYNKEIA